ncbi:MAG: ferredoxin [Lachnospiraceae bacterium]|uniref:Ferredoxin n=1 Tax=Candidatus Weimeria bifida TaxID=2599074 RepID=A0A6N7IZW8_9FIRM|nr:ferredoxin [Candidatus Weimeria bifida]RRF96736.1 MAG: ferredoxin [Lachnospiraceae bacterium]
MKYVVDDSCIGCGLCEGTCPEIFSIGDDGKAHAKDIEVPEDQADAAAEAMDGCPVGAIQEA